MKQTSHNDNKNSIGFGHGTRTRSRYFMNKRGFTLIEIIVLIIMAGIIIPAIVVPFVTGIRGSNKPEMVATAMYFAHQRMEELMKYDYANANLTPIAITGYADVDTLNFPNYQWQWEIYYVDNNFLNPSLTNNRNYKWIHVRVRDPMLNTYEVYAVVTNFP